MNNEQGTKNNEQLAVIKGRQVILTFLIPLFSLLILALLFAACATAVTANQDDLDLAIRDASDYLNDNIPAGSKIVILNVQSDSAALSDYIIDYLITNAVNDRIFSVVDRAQLDLIREEQNFQWAGEVDDNLALEVGRFFGAQTIVSGRVSQVADRYRLTVRALEVQTAQVQGQNIFNFSSAGRTVTALMRSGGTAAASGTRTQTAASGSGTAQAAPQPATPTPAPAAATYRIGDTGPAGGIIFYDKGNSTGGWRYLEAAPEDIDRRVGQNGASRGDGGAMVSGEKGVGWGKRNTAAIMRVAASNGGGFGWPGQVADAYELNDFDDWFLPSMDELKYMYGNLHMKGLGDFRNDWYWTSTFIADGNGNNYAVNFSDGRDDFFGTDRQFFVRPIRQF